MLSTLPAITNVIAGYAVGQFVQQKGKLYEGLAKLLLIGITMVFVAYCWNMVFPINKKLWTSSFVLITVGLDCILLAAIIYIIDFQKKTKWTWFFEVFGKNPLFIYLLSELLVTILYLIPIGEGNNLFTWLYINIFNNVFDYFGSLLFAISFMLVCWTIGYWLNKRKIYIRV